VKCDAKRGHLNDSVVRGNILCATELVGGGIKRLVSCRLLDLISRTERRGIASSMSLNEGELEASERALRPSGRREGRVVLFSLRENTFSRGCLNMTTL
jgi:hypothetical protein